MADTGRTPEDELREALAYIVSGPPDNGVSHRRALAALDRLVSERDRRWTPAQVDEAIAIERARVAALQEALTQIEAFCDTHMPFASEKSEVVARRCRDRARAALAASSETTE